MTYTVLNILNFFGNIFQDEPTPRNLQPAPDPPGGYQNSAAQIQQIYQQLGQLYSQNPDQNLQQVRNMHVSFLTLIDTHCSF